MTEQLSEAVEAYRQAGGVKVRAAELLGIPVSTFKDRLRKAEEAGLLPDETGEEYEELDDGNRVQLSKLSDVPIKSVDALIQHANIDTSVWKVSRFWCGHTAGMWKVSAQLDRKIPKQQEDLIEQAYQRLKDVSPKYPKPPKAARITGDNLMVLSLYDVHFGKLGWAPEVGADTDLNTTAEKYRDAWHRLIERSRSWDYGRVMIPFGNDFVNIDGMTNETSNGTPQDTDGRYHKIVDVATQCISELVEVLAGHSQVDVVFIPGNHDYKVSWHIAHYLEARFASHERVAVDRSPAPRKHYGFGKCHFMLTHGNNERLSDLPTIMATERPDLWANAVCREVHMGHLHTKNKFHTQDIGENRGVVIRYFSSISGTDLWHFKKGYIGNRACGEAHLYCPDEGYIGNVIS